MFLLNEIRLKGGVVVERDLSVFWFSKATSIRNARLNLCKFNKLGAYCKGTQSGQCREISLPEKIGYT